MQAVFGEAKGKFSEWVAGQLRLETCSKEGGSSPLGWRRAQTETQFFESSDDDDITDDEYCADISGEDGGESEVCAGVEVE